MRPLISLISIEQAMQLIHDNLVIPTKTEEVPLLKLIEIPFNMDCLMKEISWKRPSFRVK